MTLSSYKSHRARLMFTGLILAFAMFLAPLATTAHSEPSASPLAATAKPRIMVALVFGQSNAANFGESRHTSDMHVFAFHEGRWYQPATDPLPGANGEGGSVWTRLGDRLITQKVYAGVVFVPVAIGGTEIARWAPGGDLHPLLLKTIDDATKSGLKFTHLLWHQGESDAVLGTSRADYEARFLAMLASIRAHGVAAPVFVAVATRCGQYPPNWSIELAQRELVNPDLGIYAGPNTDWLGPEYRHDGCHLSNQGLDLHADMWVNLLKSNLTLTQ
jgi:Carbohydrate esterase, sialic acid-specific acetylesterase